MLVTYWFIGLFFIHDDGAVYTTEVEDKTNSHCCENFKSSIVLIQIFLNW
jgi:hypothetical protein